MPSREYDTLSEAMTGLREEGYSEDLTQAVLKQEDGYYTVVSAYRFEGITNPGDSSVLYAIQSEKGEKGIIVDTYGANSDPVKSEAIQKLKYESF